MKLHILVLAVGGLVAAATAAQAQKAPASTDPIEAGQSAFGEIVAVNFHVPDQVAPPGTAQAIAPTLGGALRTSLEIPGSAWVAIVKPFADADAAANPTPAPVVAPAPRAHRRARLHRRAPAQG